MPQGTTATPRIRHPATRNSQTWLFPTHGQPTSRRLHTGASDPAGHVTLRYGVGAGRKDGGFRHMDTAHAMGARPDNANVATRVLVVEDDGFTRMLLRGQLEQLGYEVVADTGAAAEALDAAISLRPDVALLDLDLGRGPTGIDVAYGLRRQLPTIGLVMLTSYADTRLIGEQRGLPPGGLALVKRTLEDATILDAALRMAVDPSTRPKLASLLPVSQATLLSDGQAEILRLVAHGFSNAEIARRRHLSESAVVKAVGRLVDQLGLTTQSGDNQRVLLTQAYFALTGTTSGRRD